MDQPIGQTLEIRISTVQHKSTDLMLAYSDDLPGLLVQGRSHEDIRSKLPAAIKELLEAKGEHVSSVEAIDEFDRFPGDFRSFGFLARAEMCLA